MPASVQNALVLEYADMIEHTFQQEMVELREHVRVKSGCTGTMTSFEIMGKSETREITGERDTDTVWQDIDSFLRWAPQRAWNHSVLLSRYDRLASLTDKERGYVENGVMSTMRKIDKIIIDGATAAVASGTTGTTSVAFDTTAPNNDGTGGNEIAAGAMGMTVAKLRQALGIFLVRNVGVTDIRRNVKGAFALVMSGQQMRELLAETEATSWDFIGNLGPDMPLVRGFVARFMGFDIMVSDQLNTTLPGGSIRRCLVFHKRALGLALWGGSEARDPDMEGGATTGTFFVTVDRVVTKNNAKGSQVMANFGSCRILDPGVMVIQCQE
jgi:Phage capsid protein